MDFFGIFSDLIQQFLGIFTGLVGDVGGSAHVDVSGDADAGAPGHSGAAPGHQA